MKIDKIFSTRLLAATGALGIMLAGTAPASAQVVACPAGYGYSYGAGCVPLAPGYAAAYAPPPPAYEAPIYDPFVIAFGGGHGHGHFDHGHPHGHDFHH